MTDHTTPIRDALASRQSELTRIFDAINADGVYGTEEADELYDELNNFALSIEPKLHVTVFLALGGPTEWVDVECEHEWDGGLTILAPTRMTYHYSWASEGSDTTVELAEQDALWRFCAEQIECGVSL